MSALRTVSGFLLLFTVLILSCRNARIVRSSELNFNTEYCAPTTSYDFNDTPVPSANTDSVLKNSRTLLTFMPPHDVLLANATGVLPWINQLAVSGKDSSVQARINRINLVLRIQQRLFLVTTEIAGIAAELDCAGERADQMAALLDDKDKKLVTRLTIASIIAASLTTVAAVLVQKNSTQNTISIAGGLSSAALSAFTISPAGHKLDYKHARNILSDIWYGPAASKVYPPSIWYILNEKKFSNSQQEPLIHTIKERWIKFELARRTDDARIGLLFQGGGLYDADALHTRANMLNQLQSTVRSINQDMQSLIVVLNKLEFEK